MQRLGCEKRSDPISDLNAGKLIGWMQSEMGRYPE